MRKERDWRGQQRKEQTCGRGTGISGSSVPPLSAPSRSGEGMFTWEPPTAAGVHYFRRKPCAALHIRGASLSMLSRGMRAKMLQVFHSPEDRGGSHCHTWLQRPMASSQALEDACVYISQCVWTYTHHS